MYQSIMNTELMKLAVKQMHMCSDYPKVGAVISKDGEVLSTGFRGEISGKHAERVAIEKLNQDQLRGSTIHTTLEPCAEIDVAQKIKSCCELIAESNIAVVSIGALDPNGKIYSKGMTFLEDSGVFVELFSPAIREEIERSTFKYDDFNFATGSGKRRLRSVANGKKFAVQFSKDDSRKIEFRLHPLSMPKDRIDLVSGNDSVRIASGAKNFGAIQDPMLYHDPSHFARLSAGEIAIISEPKSTMVLIVQVLAITSSDITIQWEVRNKVRG
jgi:pyrimidine deaminase RibD-like protein